MFILSQKEEGGKERFSEDSKNSTHFQGEFYAFSRRIPSWHLESRRNKAENLPDTRRKISRERTVFLRNVRENNFDIVRFGEYDRERRKCTKKIE